MVTLVSPVYMDRKFGLDYLMRAQGLLGQSYLLGYGLYSFTVTLLFSLLVLSLFYATPLFREPHICDASSDFSSNVNCPYFEFGDRRIVGSYDLQSISWWRDTYNGEPVSLYATYTAGSYGRIFGAAVMFALTMPGAFFASSYIPGQKIALVCICFASLVCGVVSCSLKATGKDASPIATFISPHIMSFSYSSYRCL